MVLRSGRQDELARAHAAEALHDLAGIVSGKFPGFIPELAESRDQTPACGGIVPVFLGRTGEQLIACGFEHLFQLVIAGEVQRPGPGTGAAG